MKVKKERVYNYRENSHVKKGRVIYWVTRDFRVLDNHALTFAYEKAIETKSELAVVYSFSQNIFITSSQNIPFFEGTIDSFKTELKELNIPLIFLDDSEVVQEIAKFCIQTEVTALVTDFNPLKYAIEQKSALAGKLSIPIFEVDAHNIVPARFVSQKQEYAAYTIRPKINKLLPEFLFEPHLQIKQFPYSWTGETGITFETDERLVFGFKSGTKAAYETLDTFINDKIKRYSLEKNDPNKDAVSNLSVYLHFGQISSNSIAWEIKKRCANVPDTETFLEELVVRKELSDNFCLYNKNYDKHLCMPNWAKKSFEVHKNDVREYLYKSNDFENGLTHDPLWNAAQTEMVKTGKMHGYMRMYWAKKILEWTPTVSDAFQIAVYLNDKYSLDGRDPNGYAGIAWSIVGIHDRAWFNRDVFGMVRYMSYNGCKNKFDVKKYIEKFKI